MRQRGNVHTMPRHQGGEGNRCISLVVALVTRRSPAIQHAYNAAGAKTLSICFLTRRAGILYSKRSVLQSPSTGKFNFNYKVCAV